MKPRFPAGLGRPQVPGATATTHTATTATTATTAITAATSPAPTMLRPQRLLHQAAQDAARLKLPVFNSLGLDSQAVRTRMVQRLRAGGVAHEGVLNAFSAVERHRFVDSALATQAYEDTSLPIGLQQTISKPSVVAHMLSLLFEGDYARQAGDLGRVLEIGTGCGYQAALLARLARTVVSIERLKPLHDKARDNLGPNRFGDVRLVFGDGRLGHSPRAPYHSIISAAGGDDLPQAWLDQLAEGGRLIAPSMDPVRGGQALLVVDRTPKGLQQRWHDPVKFVPLKFGKQ